MICGSGYTLLTNPVNYAPLVPDYVMKESIGKAMAFSLMGLSIGVIFSLGVLFEFTKDLDPKYSWRIMAFIMVLFAIGTLFMISEPPEKIDKSQGLCKRTR